MQRVYLKGFIRVPAQDLAAVEAELPNHIELTRAEPGCLEFRVEARAEAAGTFDVYECFAGRQAFDAHQARVRASTWGQVSANAEREYEVWEDTP